MKMRCEVASREKAKHDARQRQRKARMEEAEEQTNKQRRRRARFPSNLAILGF